jgi:hypothetical protein
MGNIEHRYGIAGRAAGEAALEFGRDGARIRSCQDAFVLSRIARAVVDALAEDERGAVEAIDRAYSALIGTQYVGGPTMDEAYRTAVEALGPFTPEHAAQGGQ